MLDLEPTRDERRHVYRCLLTQGVLIGNEEEIWSVSQAYRALVTLRFCMDAIADLDHSKFAITQENIKATVMYGVEGDPPYVLDQMAEYLLDDMDARFYWISRLNDDRYPHHCPFCGAAAYIGLREVECRVPCGGPRKD